MEYGKDVDSREMVRNMRRLAKAMHKRDTKPRKITGAPYISHPAAVVAMLKGWGYSADDREDATSLAIAWGHDLLEDTKVTEREIEVAAMPQTARVLASIRMLSFLPDEKLTHEAKDAAKVRYIEEIGRTAYNYALVVKIADRLCNTLDFCDAGDAWAKEYLQLGEPLFARVDECKGAEEIKATIAAVRRKVATLRCVAFPKQLTAEMLVGFRTTERGCTHPRVGEIDGVKYIAKCGSWSAYSSDEHVHNEFVADNILRVAGLNVPFCREYHVDFHDGLGEQTVRLARFADDAVPLMEAWRNGDERFRRKIREQAVAAYPVQAWIAGIDTFTYDNVLVDGDGNLIIADNGASFDFRACGKRKGWFWERKDVTDPRSGYLSLAAHPDQYVLKEILGQTTGEELWAAAKQYDFTALARRLPDSHRRHALMVYSKLLEAAVREMR